MTAKALKVTKVASTWGWMAASRTPERAARFRLLTQRVAGALTLSLGGGMWGAPHQRHQVAWLALTHGRKLWEVAPPHEPHPAKPSCMDYNVQRKRPARQCVMRPGELIWVPQDDDDLVRGPKKKKPKVCGARGLLGRRKKGGDKSEPKAERGRGAHAHSHSHSH